MVANFPNFLGTPSTLAPAGRPRSFPNMLGPPAAAEPARQTAPPPLPGGFELDAPATQAPAPVQPRVVASPLEQIRPRQPRTAAAPTAIQQSAEIRAAAKDAREEAEWNATHNPDGSPKATPDAVPAKGSMEEARRNANLLLQAAGVDIERNIDPVRTLISGSTSGGLQRAGADAYGWMTGDATSGMENIAKLQTIVSDMTLQLTGGSLGNQISNADREFIMQRVGNLGDPSVPAGARLAAWEQVKQRMANLTGVAAPAAENDEGVPSSEGVADDREGIVPAATVRTGGDDGGAPPPPIAGIREPTQQQVFSGGVQWGDQVSDMEASTSEYLQRRYGVDPGEEAEVNAFWNANIGNPDLTVGGVRQWYAQRGMRVDGAEIARAIADAQKAGVEFTGSGAEQAEAEYQRQLDEVLAQRGADPESATGALGIGAAGGIYPLLDETAGVGGFANALVEGENPIAGYQAERDLIRREGERAEEARPWLYGGSNLAGATLGGGFGFRSAAQAAQAARGARQAGNIAEAAVFQREAVRLAGKGGAGIGTYYGFGTGEGPVESLRGAAVGAGAGGALGAGAQALAPVAGRAVRAVTGRGARSPAPRRTPPTVDEARALTSETGIPVMTSDVLPPRTFLGKSAQATGERIPFAGTGGPRAAQQEARQNAVREVLEDYGALSDVPAINAIMQDLSQARSEALTRFTGVKNEIVDRLADAPPVPLPRAIAEIDRQIARLQSLRTREVEPVIARLEDWKQALQGQGIGNIELLRRQIGQSFAAPELAAVRETGEKALSAVYGPLRQDIGEFVSGRLGPREATRWNLANRELSRMAGELKMGALRRVLQSGEATPEDVGKLLFSAKPSEARALYNGLSEDGRASARAAILQRAFEKIGGEADNISPEKFLSEMKRLGTATEVFFSGPGKLRVTGLIRALQLTRHASAASAAPPTGVQNAPILVALGLGSALGGVKGAVAGASLGAMARIYESRAVRNALLRLARTKAGTPQESNALAQLQGAIAAESSNVIPFPASPARLAASDETESEE